MEVICILVSIYANAAPERTLCSYCALAPDDAMKTPAEIPRGIPEGKPAGNSAGDFAGEPAGDSAGKRPGELAGELAGILRVATGNNDVGAGGET